jgi:hypothetical protein
MMTIQLTATVDQDGIVVLTLPSNVPPGNHEMVLIIQPTATYQQANGGEQRDMPALLPMQKISLPVHHSGLVDSQFTFRREEIYDDWAR